MRVLINATSASLGGGLTVLARLLESFVRVDRGENRYLVVCRPEARPQLDPKEPRVEFATSAFGSRSLARRLVWEQLALPARAVWSRADVLFSPSNLAVWSAPIPQVLMFQNLAPFSPDVIARYRDAIGLRLRLLAFLGRLSAQRADRVVFISKAQRDVIRPRLHLGAVDTPVIYLGRDPAFAPEAKARAEPILARLGLRPPYVLAVSQLYRYKNIVELVHGFARAKLPNEVSLALVGATPEASYLTEVQSAVAENRLEARVKIVGAVPYGDLPPLYAAASLFAFPSTCESFPNILIEALASGVPVLSSNRCSMPELAGDGALYFDPDSPDEIAERLANAFQDSNLRQRLSAAGVETSRKYDWHHTARLLLDVFSKA